ncbi:MAG: GatB/YqeY domain-containing protein [Candidatus Komeilibacteria bacterium]
MSLLQQIDKDRLEAMKAQEELKLSTLRMLSSSIKNAQIAKKAELTDEEVLKVLRTEKKKRIEAAEGFTKGGKPELAEQEMKELGFIEAYLPKAMSEEELNGIVSKVLSEGNFTEMSQFGQAMGAVMKEVAGRADGQAVQAKVKELLNK